MRKIFTSIFTLIILASCAANVENKTQNSSEDSTMSTLEVPVGKTDTAYFAGGCFWCVEASFDQIEGVIEAISGYSGGTQKNPTYKEVSYGRTDHAEAVMVIYNPAVITYDVLLDIFFTAHDPTQLNRQGPDVGEQYRSAIFYSNQVEKDLIMAKINSLKSSYNDPIVTEVEPFDFFQVAEEYHQDFEEKNPNQSYIVNVSKPKIEKVALKFKDRLK